MIEVQHLTKRYGRVTAVEDVTFRVERGEILGFLGPNGAGKTTTMRILTGFMPATEGKAIVAGFDVFDQPIEAKRRTGYLPETPPLYPDMTVVEYLNFVSKLKGVLPADRKARVRTVMERTRIDDMANRQCAKLSKGYRQRVGLAQAIIHNPDVLILDEPTAGLDPKQIIETRELIKELAGDHTIILSTHILPEVSQTCDRVVIINKGHVVAVDTPDNLTARLRGSETMYLEVDTEGADAVPVLSGIPGANRVVESTRRGTIVGYEVESEQGQDIRRAAGAGDRHQRLGAAGVQADAHEPRRHLPVAHHRRDTRGGRDRRKRPRPPSKKEPPMRNILALAGKEVRSYFSSPIAYIVIGVFALLYGYFYIAILSLFRPPEHADEPVRPRRRAVDEHQPADAPAADAERHDPGSVHAAGDYDADLLGGEAVGDDRAAADLADHGLPDRDGQVSRRAGACTPSCSRSR